MSARMPRILTPPFFGHSEFLNHGQETLVSRVELRLKLGRVPPRIAREHLLVIHHHFVSMFVNILNRHLDLPRAQDQAWPQSCRGATPTVIIENVVDGDPRPRDLRPAPPVNDLRFEHGPSP